MGAERSRKHRQYAAHLKSQILVECELPRTSAAKVAMAHGINAYVVHGWRKLAREAGATTVLERFIPVSVEPAVAQAVDARVVEIDLRRGAIVVKLSWPMSAAADLSAWM